MTIEERYGEEIRARYVPGVVGMKRLAKDYGLAATSVRRLVNPAQAERDRVLSRAAKKRRAGVCEDCGGPTRYGGRNGQPVSSVCARCNRARGLASRIWTREAVISALQSWAAEHGRTPTSKDWSRAAPDGSHPAKSNVYRYRAMPNNPFASWSEAIEAAGLPHPRPNAVGRGGPGNRRFDRDEARALRAEGLSDAEIGRRFGVTSHAIPQALGPRKAMAA